MSSGNYNREMFDEAKRYLRAKVQKDIPWIDADDNDHRNISLHLMRRMAQQWIGDGVRSDRDAFKISSNNSGNDFSILGNGNGEVSFSDNAGFLWLGGYQCSLFDDYNYSDAEKNRTIHAKSSGLGPTVLVDTSIDFTFGGPDNNLAGRELVPNVDNPSNTFKIIENTETEITVEDPSGNTDMTQQAAEGDSYRINLTTPSSGDRTDTVWLDVYTDDVGVDEDANLAHTLNQDVEAQRRERLIQNIRVREGEISAPDDYIDTEGNRHYLMELGRFERPDGQASINEVEIFDERPEFIQLTNLTGSALDVQRSQIDEFRPSITNPASKSINIAGGEFHLSDGSASFAIDGVKTDAVPIPNNDYQIHLITITDTTEDDPDNPDINIISSPVAAENDLEIPEYPSSELPIALVKVNSNTDKLTEKVDDLSTVDEGIRDVRPLTSLGGGGGSFVPEQKEGTLASGEDTISTSFDLGREEGIVLVLEGIYQFPTTYTVDSTNNEIVLDSPVSAETDYFVEKRGAVSSRGGIRERNIVEISSSGETVVDPGFTIASDGHDVLVVLNQAVQYQGSDNHYQITNDNKIEFNFGLESGDKLIFIKFSGGNAIESHANDHGPGNDDSLENIYIAQSQNASHLTKSSNQTISTATNVQLAFDNSVFHKVSGVNVNLTDNRFDITDSGRYFINLQALWSNGSNWSTGDLITCSLYVNDNLQKESVNRKISTGTETVSIESYIELTDGDYVQAFVRQESGNDQVIDSSTESTFFEISL